MNNKPWEPCPRCGEKQVEVYSRASESGGKVAGWVFAIVLVGGLFWIAFGGHIIALPAFLFLGGFIVVGLILISALIGAAASAGVKGYKATCKVCSYQWEISEERAKELMTQTHAQ